MRSKRFTEARKHFTTVKEMLSVLQRIPGFESVDRSTLSRWESRSDNLLPARARAALELLEQRYMSKPSRSPVLRVGLGYGLHNFAVVVAAAVDRRSKVSLFEQRTGYKLVLVNFPTGGDALREMLAGKVDAALAADLLIGQHTGATCRRLFSILRSPLLALTRRRSISSIREFSGATIGYPTPSVVPLLLEKIQRDNAMAFGKMRGYRSIHEMSTALDAGEVDTVVGWDLWVTQVHEHIKLRKVLMVPVLFGEQTIDVAVNPTRATSPGVRALISVLHEVLADPFAFESRFAEVQRCFAVKRHDLETFLRSGFSRIFDVDLGSVLHFWNEECDPATVDLRNMSS